MALTLGNQAAKPAHGSELHSKSTKQYLTFHLGADNFGVEIYSVREIIEYQKLQDVPGISKVIKGVINLRGFGVPIIDLSGCIGRVTQEHSSRTCILIAETEFGGQVRDVGFIVDMVNEVMEISDTDIESPLHIGGDLKPQSFLLGMAKIGKDFIILLDLHNILSVDSEDLALINKALN
jgi:purine-binding chemotaxis protein CheW